METLPFESIKREVLIKKETGTSEEYGCIPEKRKIKQLIDYGIINLNKPPGPTSHQTSDYIKRILEIERAGHSGSLDPKVVGVLPIALNKATRITQVLLKAGKEYVGVMHLHKETPEEKINKTVQEFTGRIKQLPPIKSAVKRQLRERNIYYFKVLEMNEKDILFKVGCEAGTYIRKLCLAPQTEVLTSEGVKTIKELYENKEKILAFSYNKAKIDKNKIVDFQKIPFSGNLIEITTSSGIPIKVTPNHKLLTSTINGPLMEKAERIKKGDFLSRSIIFPIITKKIYIAELLDDEYLVHDKKIKEECKSSLIKKFHSIRAFQIKTKLDRGPFLSNSKSDIKIKHLKIANIFDKVKSSLSCFKTEKGKIINTNPELTEELLYLVGLIASDGNNTREKNTIRHTRIKFHNTDLGLINTFYSLTKLIFPNIKVTKKLFKDKVWQVETSNSLFATLCASLGVFSPSYKSDFSKILKLSNNLIVSFLKGYFDGDGTAFFKIKEKINAKGSYSDIRFISVDFINTKRIHQMLLKLGIRSRIAKRNFDYSTFPTKSEFIYETILTDPASKLKFCEIINSNHSRKKIILKNIREYFKKMENNPFNYLYCPLDKIKYLNKIKHLSSLLGGNGPRLKKGKIPMTIYIYNRLASSKRSIPKFSEDFIIEKVTSIKKIPFKGYVYDITVEKNHNFLIENGIVSSNCHDFGLKLGTKAHMSQLIRTKAGPFTDKTWHTLHEVKDAYEFYKEGNEKELRKIIFPFEAAVSHLPKIWVMDSTVNSLCNGADLAIPGISKLESGINEGNLTAILTLKNELICIGNAETDSKTIMEKEKGIAVKTSKVFMPTNVYKR